MDDVLKPLNKRGQQLVKPAIKDVYSLIKCDIYDEAVRASIENEALQNEILYRTHCEAIWEEVFIEDGSIQAVKCTTIYIKE